MANQHSELEIARRGLRAAREHFDKPPTSAQPWRSTERDYIRFELIPEGLQALDRLEEQLETYREFYAAWWEVEKGVIDFDLHAEAVTRLSEAHAAIIQQDSNPASRQDGP